MKVAIVSTGRNLESPMDDRFGRAQAFLICDTEGGAFQVVDNGAGGDAAQGAGILAAEAIVRLGVEGLVTPHCGPKALRVLNAAGVKVYFSQAPTVAQALDELKSGRLLESQSLDAKGH